VAITFCVPVKVKVAFVALGPVTGPLTVRRGFAFNCPRGAPPAARRSSSAAAVGRPVGGPSGGAAQLGHVPTRARRAKIPRIRIGRVSWECVDRVQKRVWAGLRKCLQGFGLSLFGFGLRRMDIVGMSAILRELRLVRGMSLLGIGVSLLGFGVSLLGFGVSLLGFGVSLLGFGVSLGFKAGHFWFGASVGRVVWWYGICLKRWYGLGGRGII
jgi:hypothetical protein